MSRSTLPVVLSVFARLIRGLRVNSLNIFTPWSSASCVRACRVFTRIAQFQGNVPFTHWVSRIAVTTCIDHLRAQKRRPEFRWADLSENEADVLDAVLTSENDVTAGDALAAHELVHKLLDQLKPDDRIVLQLLDLEQKTLAEVGELTGWNIALIKVRAFRARRKLHKLFVDLKKKEKS